MKKLFMFVVLAAGPVAAHAANVYVKTNEAEIRDGERLTSAIIAKVPRGTALTVVKDGSLRVQVKTSTGKTGFVAKTMVQAEPPSSGKGALGGFVVEDRGPSEMRSAASGRGLMESAEKMAKTGEMDPAALPSVLKMEQLAAAITAAEVDAFIREGGIQ